MLTLVVAGREPSGPRIWAGTLMGGALIPPPPDPAGPPPMEEADVEARITAAAALGAERLLSGTKDDYGSMGCRIFRRGRQN